MKLDALGNPVISYIDRKTFSLPELAADIAAVLDGLEIEKVHLVGASAGGMVSLRFARDFPQRLHSLSLVASTLKLSEYARVLAIEEGNFDAAQSAAFC